MSTLQNIGYDLDAKRQFLLVKRYLEFCSMKKIKENLFAVQLTEKNLIKKNS